MPKAVLITGPAGSGKTAHCLRVCREALKEKSPGRVIYLVPGADAVRDTERSLLLGGDSKGLIGSVVMDFVGLAFRILKEAGHFPLRRISSLEKTYLIHLILRDIPLSFFGSAKAYDGFAEVVADLIAELKRGMISSEDFLRGCLAATRHGVEREKVLELHAIYRAYQEILKKWNAYDGDGLQWMAAEALAADPSLLSSVEILLVDGFATYTPVEFEILRVLISRVAESRITLCCEAGRPEVFGFVEGTYTRLKELCSDSLALSTNRDVPEPLTHLQRTLFSQSEAQLSAGTVVAILACSDPVREVETVARHIEKIRREEGLDYKDFMVIARDIAQYIAPVSEVFAERRIPFCAAASAPLPQQPSIKSLLFALQLLNGEFRGDAILALLKNPYFNDDPDIAAQIENYVDEFGLWDEEEFRQTWTATGETTRDVNCLDAYKTRLLETLDKLRSQARAISSAEEFRDFVFQTIKELGLLRRTETAAQVAAQPPRLGVSAIPPFSPEYRALRALASLLDAICEYVRLTDLPPSDYATFLDILERGLSWAQVPTSPRSLNSVRVTSIVGGAPAAAPVVFISGLCERSFPREIVNEPFFKDRERRLINRQGKIILDERLPLSSGERFFFYTAVSRATRRLFLTYPGTDDAGEELVPSHYLGEVVRLFSDLEDVAKETPALRVVPDFDSISDAVEMRNFVSHHLARKAVEQDAQHDERQSLAALAYNELLGAGEFSPHNLIYRPPAPDAKLSEDVFSASRTNVYPTSVSELETFARCPFRHFCQYRLRLKELPRYEFSHVEEGTLYHHVLAALYREIYQTSGAEETGSRPDSVPRRPGIEAIPGGKLTARLRELADEFIKSGYSRLFCTPRMEVRRRSVETKLANFLASEIENQRTNATCPAFFELSFGQGKSRHNADSRSTTERLSLSIESLAEDETGQGPGSSRSQPDAARGIKVLLSGRMDRVDAFDREGQEFGIVLDYKRSERRSEWDLRSGTVLQAGLYMLALKELFGLEPAGAFYYFISSRRKRGIFAAEERERISGSGDVSQKDKASCQDIARLIERKARQALGYVRRILDGEIAVNPANPDECRYCPFLSVCRVTEFRG